MLVYFLLFFFKQKTAYEMRISDWSSDVCSSDLLVGTPRFLRSQDIDVSPAEGALDQHEAQAQTTVLVSVDGAVAGVLAIADAIKPDARDAVAELKARRSEEHTSELQSLMRISYAVFCLKKKKNMKTTHQRITAK